MDMEKVIMAFELLEEAGKEVESDYENGFHDGYEQAVKDRGLC